MPYFIYSSINGHLGYYYLLNCEYCCYEHGYVNILILFFKSIFNWRIIGLQYCIGFCHTSAWISHRHTYVPSLLNLPPTAHLILPSRLSEHQFELPEYYSHFPLAIYFTYSSVYTSILILYSLIQQMFAKRNVPDPDVQMRIKPYISLSSGSLTGASTWSHWMIGE